MLIDAVISGDRNVIKKEAGTLKYKDLITEIHRMWNVKSNYIGNNRGDWNHTKIIQTISEQHKRKARN